MELIDGWKSHVAMGIWNFISNVEMCLHGKSNKRIESPIWVGEFSKYRWLVERSKKCKGTQH